MKFQRIYLRTFHKIWCLKFQIGGVCILPDRFISSSKGTCILLFYTILPILIKIGQKLLEIININTHRHTHTQTQWCRWNNTCPKVFRPGKKAPKVILLNFVIYCYFNISNWRGMCSTKPIHLIFKRNLVFLI